MLFKTVQIELPRRVAAYHLLFSLIAVGCLIAGAFFTARHLGQSSTERDNLTILHRAASSIGLVYVQDGQSALQSAVERIRSDDSLVYCSVVSPDGRFLAHSSVDQVGRVYREPSGDRVQLEGFERIRFSGSDNRMLSEYRLPLKAQDELLGTLHIGAWEASLGRTVRDGFARNIPLAVAGCFAMVAVGAVVLFRSVGSFAEIDRQLRAAARADTVYDVALQPVRILGGAALGWNRLVDAVRQAPARASLDDRLNGAVQRRGREKGDDILNSLTDGIAVTGADGRITFANQAMVGIFGRSGDRAQLCGQRLDELLLADTDVDAQSELLGQPSGERVVAAELTRANGVEHRTYRVARHPLRSSASAQAGHVWSIRDVTQQKMAEKTRDQFLDAATHELRTPLANIKAYAETLSLSEMLDVEQQKQFCNTINSEATRLARFIDDLLCVSSMEVGSLSLDYQEVDVERLLQEATRKVQPQIEQKQIQLETIMPAKLPKMNIDKDKLAAVLVNLLGNAAKYTPDGGRIALNVRVGQDQLVIEVQDSGVGISKEDLPRIFDKFFRSEDPRVREQTGTGLGLSFAEEVVRKHGGTINVTSELNKGSTFTVTFPIT